MNIEAFLEKSSQAATAILNRMGQLGIADLMGGKYFVEKHEAFAYLMRGVKHDDNVYSVWIESISLSATREARSVTDRESVNDPSLEDILEFINELDELKAELISRSDLSEYEEKINSFKL